MLFLAASLFFTNPLPQEMPRAEAYLVEEKGRKRLEDRYRVEDLWYSRSLDGSWQDDDGRVFSLFTLAFAPPPLTGGETATRQEYGEYLTEIDRRDERLLFEAVDAASPIPPAENFVRPRQLSPGLRAVRYYEGTNTSVIVCAFLPERTNEWRLAVWELLPGDDYVQFRGAFTREFLDRAEWRGVRSFRPDPKAGERELLREDARHSVAVYPDWHFTSSGEIAVLDNLPSSGTFVRALTNEFVRMRAEYAKTVPSPLDGSNVLAVARFYANREDYLQAAGEDMAWSAAYWNPTRREIVAYLPQGGEQALLRTFRHEAFHQYLSYATSMIPTSPWFNEGYAEYFEDVASLDWGIEVDLEKLALVLPAIFRMNYSEFYDGSDELRRLKYRLAWSVAVFLERGAKNVRFRPFESLKADYIAALLGHQDMQRATQAAFGNSDRLKLFIAEWKKYWKDPR